jgi:hypothetical protein
MCRSTVSRLTLFLLCYVDLPKIKALNTQTITSRRDRGWSDASMERMKVDTKFTVRKNVDTKRAVRKTVRKKLKPDEWVEGGERLPEETVRPELIAFKDETIVACQTLPLNCLSRS